jgi:hypothetical protein
VAVGLLALLAPAASSSDHTATSLVRISLAGSTHLARPGAPWRFTLRVVDAAGRPVPASATVRVVAYGTTLDTVGAFLLKRPLSRTYSWSPKLRGVNTELQARVVARGVSRLVSYRVQVSGATGHPKFTAKLLGSSHAAVPGASWHYLVRALNARGDSIRGTAVIRVVVRGAVVDTLGWFGFKRRILGSYTWSPALRGSLALFQATVIGDGGTRTLVFPVRVR